MKEMWKRSLDHAHERLDTQWGLLTAKIEKVEQAMRSIQISKGQQMPRHVHSPEVDARVREALSGEDRHEQLKARVSSLEEYIDAATLGDIMARLETLEAGKASAKRSKAAPTKRSTLPESWMAGRCESCSTTALATLGEEWPACAAMTCDGAMTWTRQDSTPPKAQARKPRRSDRYRCAKCETLYSPEHVHPPIPCPTTLEAWCSRCGRMVPMTLLTDEPARPASG